jgi:hypothetical protein
MRLPHGLLVQLLVDQVADILGIIFWIVVLFGLRGCGRHPARVEAAAEGGPAGESCVVSRTAAGRACYTCRLRLCKPASPMERSRRIGSGLDTLP